MSTETIPLDDITDVRELKVMKSDQYDVLEQAQTTVNVTKQNIANINARINQLLTPPETTTKENETDEV